MAGAACSDAVSWIGNAAALRAGQYLVSVPHFSGAYRHDSSLTYSAAPLSYFVAAFSPCWLQCLPFVADDPQRASSLHGAAFHRLPSGRERAIPAALNIRFHRVSLRNDSQSRSTIMPRAILARNAATMTAKHDPEMALSAVMRAGFQTLTQPRYSDSNLPHSALSVHPMRS